MGSLSLHMESERADHESNLPHLVLKLCYLCLVENKTSNQIVGQIQEKINCVLSKIEPEITSSKAVLVCNAV